MYYKIENGYPAISPIPLEGFIEYTEGAEPQELKECQDTLSLTEAKEAKRNEIRSEFVKNSEAPVVVDTISYHGGFESASKLDAAKRMVEASGGTEVPFYDIFNLPHELTIAEAQIVILTVGADFQAKFANKQSKMVQVDNAITITEVEAISWL